MTGDRPRFMTSDELAALSDPPLRSHWGEWVFDPKLLTLTWHGYEIDLERVHSSAAILDWLFQIRNKGWGTDKVLGDLMDAFRDILDPQAHYCPSEADVRSDGGKLAKRYASRLASGGS